MATRELFEALISTQSPLIPRLGWVIGFFRFFGFSESFALSAIWAVLLVLGCLLIAGLFSRPVAMLTWFLQLASAKSGGLFSYGADNFITIGLFYLMIAPGPDRWALDWRRGPHKIPDPERLGFYRRVLQIHLCFIYFFAGLTKCLGAGWWDGSNIWRALTSPPFDVLPIQWVAAMGPLLPLMGIGVCLLETTYPVLIWPRWSRRAVLIGICTMHIGIGLVMGMYLFALITLVLNIAGFGVTGGKHSAFANNPPGPQIARQNATEC